MVSTGSNNHPLLPVRQKPSESRSERRMLSIVLQLMSTFPPLSQTFVMREVRQLRSEGWNLLIGMLRPLHRNSPARGFEDLVPYVSQATWVSADLFFGVLFFLAAQPNRVFQCLKIISKSIGSPRYIPKLLYTL